MGRTLVGVALGVPLAVAEAAALALVWPRAARGWVLRRLGRAEVTRLGRWLGWRPAGRVTVGPGFLAARAATGLLGGYLAAGLLFLGALLLAGGGWAATAGETETVPLTLPGVRLLTTSAALGIGIGGVLAGAGLAAVLGLAHLERRLADTMLGPGEREVMRRRIAELTSTRSGIVAVVDEERRRIERDLHDGVQQRGVALAMLLGRARHTGDPAAAAGFVGSAYAEARNLIEEIREVAWRIYPTALDELGLHAALAGVAERSPVPVTVHYRLGRRPVSQVETALYFVAREAITNAVKHAGAREVLVVVAEAGEAVSVVVSDDGGGGADPAGPGLRGLARRLGALDGAFEVSSPPGGPTRVAATLPIGGPAR